MYAEKIHYFTINNVQIPVIYEQSNVIPVGHVELVFLGGGNLFNPPKKPLAKISSEILNYGTKELGNVGFAELLESKAVELHVGVGNTTLSFELDFMKEYEDFAYEQFGNLLKNPNLTPESLGFIQKQLHAVFMSNSADFDYQAANLLSKTIFTETPLAYPALGNSIEEIDSVQLEDVQKYLATTLVLENLIIVIGGDLDIQQSLLKLQNYLNNLPNGQKVVLPTYQVQNAPLQTLQRDTQQAYIYFASPFNIRDLQNDGYKAQVAGFILGSSGFGSRLMEEIRVKRGLAYSAYVRPNLTRVSTYLSGYMQTALDKQEEAIAITRQIVKEFVEKGVTAEELQAAKNFILGNKPLQEETLKQRLNAKFMNYYNGLPLNYRDEFLQKVQDLDLATLNHFIQSHSEIIELTFAIVTNKNDK